jgi:hypothetical protein
LVDHLNRRQDPARIDEQDFLGFRRVCRLERNNRWVNETLDRKKRTSGGVDWQ